MFGVIIFHKIFTYCQLIIMYISSIIYKLKKCTYNNIILFRSINFRIVYNSSETVDYYLGRPLKKIEIPHFLLAISSKIVTDRFGQVHNWDVASLPLTCIRYYRHQLFIPL